MTRGLFHGIPLLAIVAGTVVLLILASEAGFRLGRRLRAHGDPGKQEDMGITLGGLLGLLGLLLAFTFGMAGDRFDDRRKLVVEEANAIGTAWLRTDLVPEPERSEARAALRAYTQARIDAVATNVPSELLAAVARSERIHESLWATAVAAARSGSTPTVALYVSAVNEVIDAHGRRVAAGLRSPIPPVIFGTLYLVAVLVLVALGFYRGLVGDRSAATTTVLSIVLAVVLGLTLDLDRPGEGYLKVSQQALQDVRATMGP